MGKYRLIGLDLDGTLLTNDKEISARNRHWIKEAEQAGIVVCFATGRGKHSSERFWDVVDSDSPLILANGAEVWKNQQELLSSYPLPAGSIPRLRELAIAHKTRYWAYATELFATTETWDGAQINDVPWLKFGMSHHDLELISELRQTITNWNEFTVTASAPTNLEICQLGISKASGLAEITGILGIKAEEVAVVGDSLNDLEMIEWAGLGVAVFNAEPVVRTAADYLAASNEEDGVAEVIELILQDGGSGRF